MRSPFAIVTLAVLLGTLLDTIIKLVGLELSVVTMSTWRFWFGGLIAIAVYAWRCGGMPTAEAVRFHALRGVVQVFTILTFFWSLTQLALAEATSIGFLAALFVPLVARVILGEKFSPLAGLAALLGFAGAAFALSTSASGAPADGNRLLGSLSAFAAAIGYAFVLVLLRLRTRKDDTETIALFTNVMPAIYLTAAMLIMQPIEGMPTLAINVEQGLWIGLLGILGFSIWWLMSIAYRHAEAQRLAPFEYLALPASIGMGWLVFGEQPDWRLYVGALIIISACLAVVFEDRLLAQMKRAQA